MTFLRVRAISTILFCVLLLFLFYAPQHLLNERSAAWNRDAMQAQQALSDGDFAKGTALCRSLRQSFSQSKNALERFLNHSDVDAVYANLGEAALLAETGDAPGAIAALSRAQGDLMHLVCIERFTWNALL